MDKFCLSESKLNEGFCYNFSSCMLKRFNNYRRNRRQLFNEVFLPSAFMVFGVYIANIDFTYRSPSKLLTPDAYPSKQKVLVNSEPIDTNSNVNITTIMGNMPQAETNFEFYYQDNIEGALTFDDFAERVYEFGVTNSPKEPYHYSSYEIYQANTENHQYKFINYVNITSEQVVGYFP